MARILNKVRAFFYVYSRSIVSPAYYKDVLETRLNFTVKYYAFLAVIVSIISTVVLTIQLVPTLHQVVEETATAAKEIYPDDFEIQFENEKWTINQKEPYTISIPSKFYDKLNKTEENVKIPRNIIVFDHNGTIDDMYTKDTFALLNERYMLVLDDNGGIRSNPLQKIPNGKMDKTIFSGFVDQAEGIKKYVPYFVGGGILVFSLVVNLFLRIPGFLALALIVWGISSLLKLGLNYQESLRIILHASTLAFTVFLVSQMFSYQIPLFGWFSVLTLGYAVMAIVTMKNIKDKDINPPMNTPSAVA